MLGALLSFSGLAVSIRSLANTLTIFEVLTVRSGGGLIIILAVALARPNLWREMAWSHMPLHLLRNGVHFAGQYAWALSLTLLPLATVFALEFTMPALASLLAYVVLRERMTVSRVGNLALGLIGVLVILRPGMAAFQPAAFLVLAAAFGFAITIICTKMLTGKVSTFAIVFWMNTLQLPIGLAGSDLWFLSRLDLSHFPALAGVAVGGVASHYFLSNAFREGDAMLVVPLDFLRMPLIAAVGWAVYGEPLDAFVFLGAGIIISGILWNLSAEMQGKPRAN